MLTVSGLPQKFHKYYDFRFLRKIIIIASRGLTLALDQSKQCHDRRSRQIKGHADGYQIEVMKI